MKSDALITSGGHSGCDTTFRFGYFFLSSIISVSVNCSCTSHLPFHEIIFTLVLLATYFARYSSGRKMTLSTFNDSIIFTAFADVQHISVSAFTSAEVFT